MDAAFWHEKWETNKIAFHQSEATPQLVAQYDGMNWQVGARVFVPLCGKTLDIAWLLARGHRVVGVELSKTAIDQLFEALGVELTVRESGDLLHYIAPNLDILVGNIFAVTAEHIGPVDAVFDRAAFVALPESMRKNYADQVATLSGSADQLLLTLRYDETEMGGPPFAIHPEEVQRCYADNFELQILSEAAFPGGLRGVDVEETAWRLTKKG